VTRQVSRLLPSDAGSVRWRVEVVRGALFKRIEEEKGLGGWAQAPRRGIRIVVIPESARARDEDKRRAVEAVAAGGRYR
jgi:hypothetical protein